MFTFSRASASAAALAFTLTLTACGGGHHHGNPGGPGPGPVGNGPTYDVIPIGLPGIAYGEVTRRGIANGGIVPGTSRGADGVAHAFLYAGSKTIGLGTFGGDSSPAMAVNA